MNWNRIYGETTRQGSDMNVRTASDTAGRIIQKPGRIVQKPGRLSGRVGPTSVGERVAEEVTARQLKSCNNSEGIEKWRMLQFVDEDEQLQYTQSCPLRDQTNRSSSHVLRRSDITNRLVRSNSDLFTDRPTFDRMG